MDKHGKYMTFDPETRIATCSKCTGIFRLNDWPMKVNVPKDVDHTFSFGIEILGVTIDNHDPRLDAFKESLDD